MHAQIVPIFSTDNQLHNYLVNRLTNIARTVSDEYNLGNDFVQRFRELATVQMKKEAMHVTLAQVAMFCDKSEHQWRRQILVGLGLPLPIYRG